MTAIHEKVQAMPLPAPSPRGRVIRRAVAVVCAAALILVLLPYALAPVYRAVDPPSTLMLWRFLHGAPVVRAWMPIDRISPSLIRATIVAEDDRFCRNRGINYGALRAAIRAELNGARRVRGGSGLTQQLAKNLFLWPGRSYLRKALEIPLALWIDLVVSKRRQLELYLNVVEWGPMGEFGAEAAARRAFEKPAAALSVEEAAMLAATLPNPRRRDGRHPSPALRRLAAVIAARARRAGDIDRCIGEPRAAP
jgi:monofunctional glycosyltransferase